MKNKKYLSVTLLLILILYLSLELFLPQVVENRIEKEILENTKDVKGLEVEVNSFPAWELLFSRADRVKLTARMVNIDGLYLSSISALYKDVIIAKGEIKGDNTDLKILISEKDLNQYVTEKYSGFENFQIKLVPEKVYLSGDLKFFKSRIKVQLNGEFSVHEAERISFVPENLSIEKLQIPRSIIREFTEQLGFYFDLTTLDLPLKIDKIKISDKELYLLGGTAVRKAGL